MGTVHSYYAQRTQEVESFEGSGPPRDDPKFEALDDEDSLIMTWLWNSMTPEISWNYIQGTFSITEYYDTLNGLWIELDQYQELKMCKVDSIAYTRLIDRGKIFKFLHGLNSEYDPIRTRRSVMLDKGCSNIGSAMVTAKGFTKRSTSKGKPFTKSNRGEYCPYCKQPGHTKDTCYKLYEKEK
ncbi:hypothetical protein CR513_58853, partial [Mucuna pruriens]